MIPALGPVPTHFCFAEASKLMKLQVVFNVLEVVEPCIRRGTGEAGNGSWWLSLSLVLLEQKGAHRGIHMAFGDCPVQSLGWTLYALVPHFLVGSSDSEDIIKDGARQD